MCWFHFAGFSSVSKMSVATNSTGSAAGNSWRSRLCFALALVLAKLFATLNGVVYVKVHVRPEIIPSRRFSHVLLSWMSG